MLAVGLAIAGGIVGVIQRAWGLVATSAAVVLIALALMGLVK